MIEYLGTVKLGGFYLNDEILDIPKRPYNTDEAIFTGSEIGDIHSFKDYPDLSKWSIKDTPNKEENKLSWHKFKIDRRNYYMCDRVIINDLSFNDLKDLVNGVYIYIDGNKYLYRLPTKNEWELFVVAENNVIGVPSVEKSLGKINSDTQTLNHNIFWNWIGVYTFVSDDKKVCYGYYSPTKKIEIGEEYSSGDTGFRPILEEIYEFPIIEGQEGRLGEFKDPFSYSYSTISYIDDDVLNITEKLNDVIINSYSTSEQRHMGSIDLVDHWDDIPVGVHEIVVEAVNVNNERTIKKAQFNTPPSTFINKEGLEYFTQRFWSDKIKPFVTELSKKQGGLILDSREHFTGIGSREETNLADNGICIKCPINSSANIVACFNTDAIKLGNYGLVTRIAIDKKPSGSCFSVIVYRKNGDSKIQLGKKDFVTSDFKEVNKYQSFYMMFEYTGTKVNGETIDVEIKTATNSTDFNISLDYVLISQMLPAVFI